MTPKTIDAPKLTTVADLKQAASRRRTGQKFLDLDVWRKAVVAIANDEPQSVGDAESLDEAREGLKLTWDDFQADVDLQRRINENAEFLNEAACDKKADAIWAETCRLATERDALQAKLDVLRQAHHTSDHAGANFNAARREIKQLMSGNPRLFAAIEKAFEGDNCGVELPKTPPFSFMFVGAGAAPK